MVLSLNFCLNFFIVLICYQNFESNSGCISKTFDKCVKDFFNFQNNESKCFAFLEFRKTFERNKWKVIYSEISYGKHTFDNRSILF